MVNIIVCFDGCSSPQSLSQALFLSHPSKDTRDTSGYKKFRDIAKVCEVCQNYNTTPDCVCLFVVLKQKIGEAKKIELAIIIEFFINGVITCISL